MSEIVNPPRERRRLEYGAVPLRPWTASHPEMPGSNYYSASLQHLTHKLDSSISLLTKRGYVSTPELLNSLYSFCNTSLMGAQTERVSYHHDHSNDQIYKGDPEIIKAAYDGTATPKELLELLIINGDVQAMELAKLTHPFDALGSDEMLAAVQSAVEDFGGVCADDNSSRYKLKRVDREIPAVVVVQKSPVACLETDEGYIELTVRKSFMLRGDDDVKFSTPLRLDALVADKDQDTNLERLFASVAEVCTTPELIDATPWLDILTTSVYAKYILMKSPKNKK